MESAYLHRKEIDYDDLQAACPSAKIDVRNATIKRYNSDGTEGTPWHGRALYRPLLSLTSGQWEGHERILDERINKHSDSKPNDKYVTYGAAAGDGITPIGFSRSDLMSMDSFLIVCAGLADGFSLYESLGFPVACGVGEANIPKLVKLLRPLAGNATIIVATDNDTAGHHAGNNSGTKWACPKSLKDWSDVRQQQGLHAIREQLLLNMREPVPDVEPPALQLVPKEVKDAIISAAYANRAITRPDGVALAAAIAGTTDCAVEKTFRDHISLKNAPLHRNRKPEASFSTFKDAAADFLGNGSAFVVAKLGSGKTSTLGGELVTHAKQQGVPIIACTKLVTLVNQMAGTLGLTGYNDSSSKAFFDGIQHGLATTLASLTTSRISGHLERVAEHKGLVIIDEAATIAEELLSSAGSNSDAPMRSEQHRFDTLKALEKLRDAGCRFLLLDGDVTPAAAELASWLGCRIVECTESRYPEPAAIVLPEYQQAPMLRSSPCHAEIVAKLKAGKRVFMPTDSIREAKALHALYSGYTTGETLLIHSENTGNDEQAAYLSAPEVEAQRYQLVVASPVLSVGFSVTSVEAHVYCVANAGTLGATGLWQMARRYRRAAGNVVRFIVRHNLCRPLRDPLSSREIKQDITSHARLLGMLDFADNIGMAGVIATTWQKHLHDANPLHSLIGHLQNIGLDVTITHDADNSGHAARKLVKEEIKQDHIKSVSTAESLTQLDAATLREKGKRGMVTPEEAAQLARNGIEVALRIQSEELESDGSLPAHIVEDAEFKQLVTRVNRRARLTAHVEGRTLEESDLGFVHMNHHTAQCTIMAAIIDDLQHGDEITVTADVAREIANKYRSKIHVAYKDISNPPRRKAKDQRYTSWLNELLVGWGYENTGSIRIGEDGNRGRQYQLVVDANVERYSCRFCEALGAKVGDAKTAGNLHGYWAGVRPLVAI
jgi:hypothetical protein